MSAIANLANIPGTPEEFLQWSFAHANHHANINAAVYNQLGIVLPSFVLDPFNPDDAESAQTWAYQHQLMHQNQNAVLGIEGLDLTEVDWQDPGNRASWINSNFSEHFQASNFLGIG